MTKEKIIKRVACYVRVSHEEQVQHGISVDAQIEALTQYAKENHYKIVNIYSDAGISARKSYKNRPALLQMINDCQLGKIDLILICKLDRFFRSVPDYYAVMSQIGDVPWKAIHEDYETETANGVFKVNIMLSVAQSEADRTSERIKKVFEYKKAKGEVCSGGVAWGYKIVNKRWVKDENLEPYIDELFNTYLSTLSNKLTQDKLLDMGFHITAEMVRRILKHPAYYGALPYVSETYITEEQHAIIANSKHRNIRTRKHDYIFTGLCYCGMCGSRMIGERTINIRKDGSEQHSVRYMCYRHEQFPKECYGASVRESLLEEYLLNNLELEIQKQIEEYNFKIASAPQDKKIKIDNAQSRLKRIRDLYELGDITLEEYKNKKSSIQEEIEALNLEPKLNIKPLPDNWIEMYNSLDIKHKNAYWTSIIDHVEVGERLANTCKIYL